MPAESNTTKNFNALRERIEREIEDFKHIESQLSEISGSDLVLLKNLSRKHARVAPNVEKYEEYLSLLDRLEEAEAILTDDNSDDELGEMALEEKKELESSLNTGRTAIEQLLIPPNPDEGKNIFIEIRAGTGGDEAALFVGDLLKMYLRFAEKTGLRIELLSSNETELGGYKEVIFAVQGQNAYKFLHQEGGAHRVQRIPVTESGGRIHTSAVTVAVMPEAEEEELFIDEKDLRIDVFRASGAGGQHVNKTDSAVRILHIPTGIIVSCQDARSQHKNRSRAMSVLRARLSEKQQQEKHEAENLMKKDQVGSGDRSERIRTYNFPQGRVTDHRVGYTSYNLAGLMEGDMQELLDVLDKARRDAIIQNLGL